MKDALDNQLYDLSRLGALRIGEFLEATAGMEFAQKTSRLRDQAKVALSAIVTHLLREAGTYHLLPDDLDALKRFSEREFLES